jgi:hypothetical protein
VAISSIISPKNSFKYNSGCTIQYLRYQRGSYYKSVDLVWPYYPQRHLNVDEVIPKLERSAKFIKTIEIAPHCTLRGKGTWFPDNCCPYMKLDYKSWMADAKTNTPVSYSTTNFKTRIKHRIFRIFVGSSTPPHQCQIFQNNYTSIVYPTVFWN